MFEWLCERLPRKIGVPLFLVGGLIIYILHFPLDEETRQFEREAIAFLLGLVLSVKAEVIVFRSIGAIAAVLMVLAAFAYGRFFRSRRQFLQPASSTQLTGKANPRPVNLDVWAEKDSFRMWDVQFLWCDFEPFASHYKDDEELRRRLPDEIWTPVNAWKQAFTEDAAKGLLKIDRKPAGSFLWWETSRMNLNSYAKLKGRCPQFLVANQSWNDSVAPSENPLVTIRYHSEDVFEAPETVFQSPTDPDKHLRLSDFFGPQVGRTWIFPLRVTSNAVVSDLHVEIVQLHPTLSNLVPFIPIDLPPAQNALPNNPVQIGPGVLRRFSLISWAEGSALADVVLFRRNENPLSVSHGLGPAANLEVSRLLVNGMELKIRALDGVNVIGEAKLQLSISNNGKVAIGNVTDRTATQRVVS